MKKYEIVGCSKPFASKSGKYYMHIYLTFADQSVDGLGVRDIFVEATPEMMSHALGDVVYVFEENRRVVGLLKA